jgi:hypothetical protein
MLGTDLQHFFALSLLMYLKLATVQDLVFISQALVCRVRFNGITAFAGKHSFLLALYLLIGSFRCCFRSIL